MPEPEVSRPMRPWLVGRLLAVVVLPLLLSSCSFFAESTRRITIIPSHSQAIVSVNGEEQGMGTRNVWLARDEDHTITATYQGVSGTGRIERVLSGTGKADLMAFMFVLPLAGVFADGFWDLQPDIVVVVVPGHVQQSQMTKRQEILRQRAKTQRDRSMGKRSRPYE